MSATETRYARANDLSIAWQTLGEGAYDLLVIPGLVSHVEAFHQLPGYASLLTSLGRFARVITFDKRGNGLSDRVAEPPSLPERADDVRAVLDAAGSKRAVLFGISEGAALAIWFASREPDRTHAVALFGGFPRLLTAPGYDLGYTVDAFERFTSGTVETWGTGTPLATLFGPSLVASQSSRELAARCERASATPTALRALWQMAASIDVRDMLPQLRVPTLVMHRAGDRIVPVAVGRWLADHIADARWRELPGDDHFPFAGDSAPIIEAIRDLLDVPAQVTAHTCADRPRAGDMALDTFDRLLADAALDPPFTLGRFHVTRRLGGGGMGSVFLADDPDLGRRVALKVMHRGDPAAYLRFRREAMAVASLAHPEVVQIFELGLDASMPYLVMEYVAGGTVAGLGCVPWRRALRVVASAARGLGAAHALGIVHRDVKPGNLLLPERDGDRVKVADFGIAKLALAEPLTNEGAVIGTIGYLSPEQARGEHVDARADVWSLGALLYRLLTGQAAFVGTPSEVLAATLSRPFPDPRDTAPDVPATVANVVTTLAAQGRDARPVDGNAVVAMLEGLAD